MLFGPGLFDPLLLPFQHLSYDPLIQYNLSLVMPKNLPRIIVLLLVPCLVADSVSASQVRSAIPVERKTMAETSFQEEALAVSAESGRHVFGNLAGFQAVAINLQQPHIFIQSHIRHFQTEFRHRRPTIQLDMLGLHSGWLILTAI